MLENYENPRGDLYVNGRETRAGENERYRLAEISNAHERSLRGGGGGIEDDGSGIGWIWGTFAFIAFTGVALEAWGPAWLPHELLNAVWYFVLLIFGGYAAFLFLRKYWKLVLVGGALVLGYWLWNKPSPSARVPVFNTARAPLLPSNKAHD
jgi:hypothetical protein